MTAIYGLFTTPELAQQAVDGLKAAGIAEKDITVQSSEPLEEYAFGAVDRETLKVRMLDSDRKSGWIETRRPL